MQQHSLDVGLLLGAALNEHCDDLDLLAWRQLNFHQLVPSLLKLSRRHDGEVDSAPQINQVGLGLILQHSIVSAVRHVQQHSQAHCKQHQDGSECSMRVLGCVVVKPQVAVQDRMTGCCQEVLGGDSYHVLKDCGYKDTRCSKGKMGIYLYGHVLLGLLLFLFRT